jgi:hypothetical protein
VHHFLFTPFSVKEPRRRCCKVEYKASPGTSSFSVTEEKSITRFLSREEDLWTEREREKKNMNTELNTRRVLFLIHLFHSVNHSARCGPWSARQIDQGGVHSFPPFSVKAMWYLLKRCFKRVWRVGLSFFHPL